ncbi:winged helix DNA-binding domain-containing protein [Cryobacterium adonitolivorans]|uniref:Winged helix DNA-binding domain-containing protein n=1 Tax=Cryobacterium adonitolivorans TaxID=1259189 RepID=A0A4R8VYF2_9MICO|nr:winged helix DNA-binding domain-containing protein [Cryobacterium adonitolivorans]TFB97812.1 winged helix DNA-binding domain-containing protein [Cryobacterium adonitolivorans]
MTRASRSDITRRRLASQALTGSITDPALVVDRMLAVQAQDLRWAKWAVAVRAPGSTSADVDGLIDSGRIVRSWPMRGTLHLVPAPDLAWMLGLTTARLWAGAATRRRDLGLDEATIEHARTVVEDALSGGRELTRAGFLALLESHGISTDGQRGYHLIWHLAQSGTLCWGRQLDSQQMLVLLSEWVPRPRLLERDQALGEFLLRYLAGHGPAPLTDFAWWSQLTMADAKTALAVAGGQLDALDVDGVRHLLPQRSDLGPLGRAAPGRGPTAVLALPGFDEYLLGYRDRSFAIEPENLTRVVPGKNGIFLPILVRGGRIFGTWRRDWQPRAITVHPEPFSPQPADSETSTERALHDYARFLGRPVQVLPAPPTAPPAP